MGDCFCIASDHEKNVKWCEKTQYVAPFFYGNWFLSRLLLWFAFCFGCLEINWQWQFPSKSMIFFNNRQDLKSIVVTILEIIIAVTFCKQTMVQNKVP